MALLAQLHALGQTGAMTVQLAGMACHMAYLAAGPAPWDACMCALEGVTGACGLIQGAWW